MENELQKKSDDNLTVIKNALETISSEIAKIRKILENNQKPFNK